MPWQDRYVRADASGTGTGLTDTSVDAWTLPQAITNIGTGGAIANWRINVRGGIYTFGATSFTFSINSTGSTSLKVWWRGFNSTPGDLDTTPVTPNATWTGPDLRFTTGFCVISGLNNVISNFRFINTAVTTTLGMAPSNIGIEPILVRCWIENQSTGSALNVGQVGSAHKIRAYGCYLKTSPTAARVLASTVSHAMHSCIFDGGVHGYTPGASGGVTVSFYNCIFKNQSGSCVFHNNLSSTTSFIAHGNIFYKPGNHGIAFNNVATPAGVLPVMNNVFVGCGGYGLVAIDGTALSIPFSSSLIRIGNKFFGSVLGNELILGDYEGHENRQLLENPFVDGDNWDFQIKPSSISAMGAFPFAFSGPTTQLSNDYAGPYGPASSGGGGGVFDPLNHPLIN